MSTPKEVRAALGILDEAAHKLDKGGLYDSEAFELIRKPLEDAILNHSKQFVAHLQEADRTPREWVYHNIRVAVWSLLGSGEYHIYRGTLNPVGPGETLLQMCYAATDELVQMDIIDSECAEEQNASVRQTIQEVG